MRVDRGGVRAAARCGRCGEGDGGRRPTASRVPREQRRQSPTPDLWRYRRSLRGSRRCGAPEAQVPQVQFDADRELRRGREVRSGHGRHDDLVELPWPLLVAFLHREGPEHSREQAASHRASRHRWQFRDQDRDHHLPDAHRPGRPQDRQDREVGGGPPRAPHGYE